MPWIGTLVTMPGSLTGFEGTIYQVRTFSVANTLTNVTIRVTDAPSGGTVVVRLHDQADGLGNYLQCTIADGETFATASGSVSIGAGLWQEIVTGVDDDAMNLSGEYTMGAASGIVDYFTTLAAVKLDADIAGTDADRDTVITSIMAGVTREMQDWMQRDILQGTTTEKIDGSGYDTICTTHYPITAITSLTEGGTALVENTDFESVDADLETGNIIRLSGGDPAAWALGRRNIAITYDHGYVTVPESLEQACRAMTVARYFDTVQSGKGWRGLTSKGVDPTTATGYDKEIWQREVIPAMKPYKRMTI